MNATVVKKVSAYAERHRLLRPEDRYLVALSGGADSVALLRILLALGCEVEAAHCNFHLRGEEADRDERFCVLLCEKLHVKLHRAHFDTRLYASQHHISVEMAARDLRYGYFHQLRKDLGLQDICVAHHRDDAAETILLNLIRGTGLRGLTGIRPRQGHIVRPLLALGKEEILDFLESIGQDYVTDTTNLDPHEAVRNKIRLEVLPLLREINPSITASLLATASHLQAAEQAAEDGAQQLLPTLVIEGSADDTSKRLCIDLSKRDAPSFQWVLFEILSERGFSPAIINQIAAASEPIPTGRRWHSASHTALSHRGMLIVEPRLPAPPQLSIPEPGNYVVSEERWTVSIAEEQTVSTDALTATLDAEKVIFPLRVRLVSRGDRFVPLGMKGTKLISDFLTDRHVPLSEKERARVVADGEGRIVWLVGHRPDHRFRITPQTQRTLVISLGN